jgi:hypothetical protein
MKVLESTFMPNSIKGNLGIEEFKLLLEHDMIK